MRKSIPSMAEDRLCTILRPKCTLSEHIATASWARPAKTLGSTQRYSLERQASVLSSGGYLEGGPIN
eukprot:6329060-Pyramimonas_sp.AAC.1